MPILVQQSEATAAYRRMYFHCVDATDGMTPETGEAGGQPQISLNGAGWGNTTNVLVAIGNGRYYVELVAATEVNSLGIIEGRYKSANTAESIGTTLQVVPFDPYDSVRLGLTALPNAAADAAGGLPISDAGGLAMDSILTYAISSAAWGSINSGIVFRGVVTADDPGVSFTISGLAGQGAGAFVDANTSWYAYVLRDAGGAAAAPQGEIRKVTGYTSASGQFTTDAFTVPVVTGDDVIIISAALTNSLNTLTIVEAIKAVTDVLPDAGALTTLINHLTDIKGTGFAKNTHSLPQCLTATGFSTHSAANVKTAIEAAGSHLALIKAVTDILFGHSTTISSVVTPDTVFDIADGIPNADGYNNMVIAIKDVSSGYWITKKVTDYDTTGHFRITIDSDAEFPLAENDIVKFSNLSYSPTVAGGSLTVDEILDGLTTGHDIPNSVGRKIGRLREAF